MKTAQGTRRQRTVRVKDEKTGHAKKGREGKAREKRRERLNEAKRVGWARVTRKGRA